MNDQPLNRQPPQQLPMNCDEATRIHLDGCQLEVRTIGNVSSGGPILVLLHEGLGCVALWRDFPDRLAQATGLPALLYSRQGYGCSEVFEAPLEPAFMHHEARAVLPTLLAHFRITRPVLVGHSDGASIALIHAGEFPGSPEAVVALAPHLFVEQITIDSISALASRFAQSDLPVRLGKYHRDPLRTFAGWSGIWLDAAFRSWNIEEQVAAIKCPVLAIQGLDDEYGTMRQVERLSELAAQAQHLAVANCGHSPFIDQPDQVLEAIVRFVQALPA